MSFFNADNKMDASRLPGCIDGCDLRGLNERVAIDCFKVFDAGILQKQLKMQKVQISEFCQCNMPCQPYTFVSAKTASTVGVLRNIEIIPLPDRRRYSRVTANLLISMEIKFNDADGKTCYGYGSFNLPIDVVLAVPENSLTPCEFPCTLNGICPSGIWLHDNEFALDVCLNAVIKCGINCELLVPSFGYCLIPQAINYNENICKGFFDQPLYPC